MNTDNHGFKKLLLRHETVLLLVVAVEWLYFNAVGPRFGSLDNSFDIVRHSVEIGLLALVMTPIILTGGIDLSVTSIIALSSFGDWAGRPRAQATRVVSASASVPSSVWS